LESPVPEPSPPDQVARLASGYWHTQAIYAAAKLGVADALAAGPRPADDLAAAVGAAPGPLYRLLRALASLGLFAEDDRRRFALTPLGECLRTGVPGSVRSLCIMRGEWQYAAWGRLLDTVRTGRPGFELEFGTPLFDYLAEHPEKGAVFDDAMTGVHGRETAAMLDAYAFTGIGTLADIGCGNGEVVASILNRYPAMRGILFDRPAVIERTRAALAAAGLAGRWEAAAGDFFTAVPGGADAYLLRHVIHDWDDDRCVTILRNCRAAMHGRGKLLVVEGVVPPGNDPAVSKFFDLAMMVLPGGMERTGDEFGRLFAAGGFRVTRVVPTATWVSVIEGEPA
jgi:hypothetical protein